MAGDFVETVLGPVRVEDLGAVMPHEHFPSGRAVTEDLEPPAGYRAKLERWEREVIREAQSFGVRTIVEVTPIGCLRMVPMMQRLSRQTGINVVASTGLYVEGRRPAWVAGMSAEELAEVFVRELTVGMKGTDARAWMIKVAGRGGKEMSGEDRKVFVAAAIASRATGAAITTHSCDAVRMHFDFLVESGAEPSRLYIGHADLVGDESEHLHVARAGGHLIFTCWGIEHFVSQDLLASRVARIVDAGFPRAVLMSIDYALVVSDNRMDLVTMEYECPDRTMGFLFRYALPKLREKGITEDHIRRFTVDNPREMLARPEPARDVKPRVARPREKGVRHLLPVGPKGACAPFGQSLWAWQKVPDPLFSKTFSPQTAADALGVANAFTAAWPYTRPIDAELVAHWKTLEGLHQPERMLIAYRDGAPRAFLHGERLEKEHHIHLLAMVPGAAEEAAWLLARVEEEARAAGVERLCGPHWRTGAFYGGYVLGCEPYLPHWAVDGVEAFVRAGFRISHPAVILVARLSGDLSAGVAPKGYEVVEAEAKGEFAARTFRFAARFEGKEVATCTARLYPKLHSPGGSPVGQIGFVGTDEAHRGKGLAREMVKMSLARLKAWGAAEALIATGLDNYPALRAYENAGFERRFNINEWSKTLKAT